MQTKVVDRNPFGRSAFAPSVAKELADVARGSEKFGDKRTRAHSEVAAASGLQPLWGHSPEICSCPSLYPLKRPVRWVQPIFPVEVEFRA